MSEVAAYLPTEERARALGLPLPEGEPGERLKLVALVVRAEVLRRTWWEEPLHRRVHHALPLAPPEPTTMTEAVHRTLVKRGDGSHVIRHWVDTVVRMHEVYVPAALAHVPAMLSFESALEALIAPQPPECLRCHDFRPQAGQSAYRGGANRVPDFHGHMFADTIDKASAGLDSIAPRGRVLRRNVWAWAWPFVWLRYATATPREVALLVDAHHELHVYSGMPPED
ncbi:MAG: hypothetical protein WKG00_35980 [Polyangiaceae bacterium]